MNELDLLEKIYNINFSEKYRQHYYANGDLFKLAKSTGKFILKAPKMVFKEGIKNNTDALYYMNNTLIPRLKELEKEIANEGNVLQSKNDELSYIYENGTEDSGLIKGVSFMANTMPAAVPTYEKVWLNQIKKWLTYGENNGWFGNTVEQKQKVTNAERIHHACYQVYLDMKDSKRDTAFYKTFASSLEGGKGYIRLEDPILDYFWAFVKLLGDSGILNKVITGVDDIYTNVDQLEYSIAIQEELVNQLEDEYSRIYNESKSLANKYTLTEVRLAYYDFGKSSRENRRLRKENREKRRAARRAVRDLIKSLNEKDKTRQVYIKNITKKEAELSILVQKNEQKDSEKFAVLHKAYDDLLNGIEPIDTEMDKLEEEVLKYADDYSFAERKYAKFKRKQARRKFRTEKKALKETYKAEYGKNWKTADYKAELAEKAMAKHDTINEYAGFGNKLLNAYKTAVFALPRGAFLVLLASNVFEIAGRLRFLKNEEPKYYNIFLNRWVNIFGGNKEDINDHIEKWGKTKPLFGIGAKFGFDKMNVTGIEETAAATATASPIIAATKEIFAMASGALGIYMQLRNLNGDSSKILDDEDEKNLKDNQKEIDKNTVINDPNLSEEQKQFLIACIEEGYSLATAIDMWNEKQQQKLNIKVGIFAGLTLVVVVAGLLMFKNK